MVLFFDFCFRNTNDKALTVGIAGRVEGELVAVLCKGKLLVAIGPADGLDLAGNAGEDLLTCTAALNRNVRVAADAEVMDVEMDPFYGAPCVIVVLADPDMPTWIDDGSLVLGNLMNAAHALGLGSCWINRARQTFDRPEGKALLEKWGLPERYRGVGNCILGYADEEPAPKERLKGRIIKV